MSFWQLAVLYGFGFALVGLGVHRLGILLETMHRTNELAAELNDRVKLLQTNVVYIEKFVSRIPSRD